MNMKKSLLIAIAALFVAAGANAQVAKTSAKFALPKGVSMHLMTKNQDATSVIAKKAISRRAEASVAGTYIIESNNWDADFTENAEFTIEEATGTIKAGTWNESEELEFTRDFEYNVKLTGFGYANGTAYGYFDSESAYLLVPMQVIYTHSTYGEVVLSGSARSESGGVNYGADIVLAMTEDGGFEFDEEYCTGWFSFLPNYTAQPGATWNYGFDCAVFAPNAVIGDVECHIEGGAWGSWAKAEYNAYVEDFGTELVIHNFLGLCPISVTLDGDKASIATPVRVMDYDYADEGEDPNYMQIWQWDSEFENILNPGAITGTISTLTDGSKLIEFYDTEYKEAWTDEYGDHEAGNYIITDYTKWFMVHTTWGETGAYFWGEARNMYVNYLDENSTGISEVNTANKTATAKTYNMLGQQVNAGAKGLLIRDGRKFIAK